MADNQRPPPRLGRAPAQQKAGGPRGPTPSAAECGSRSGSPPRLTCALCRGARACQAGLIGARASGQLARDRAPRAGWARALARGSTLAELVNQRPTRTKPLCFHLPNDTSRTQIKWRAPSFAALSSHPFVSCFHSEWQSGRPLLGAGDWRARTALAIVVGRAIITIIIIWGSGNSGHFSPPSARPVFALQLAARAPRAIKSERDYASERLAPARRERAPQKELRPQKLPPYGRALAARLVCAN